MARVHATARQGPQPATRPTRSVARRVLPVRLCCSAATFRQTPLKRHVMGIPASAARCCLLLLGSLHGCYEYTATASPRVKASTGRAKKKATQKCDTGRRIIRRQCRCRCRPPKDNAHPASSARDECPKSPPPSSLHSNLLGACLPRCDQGSAQGSHRTSTPSHPASFGSCLEPGFEGAVAK